MKKKRTRDVRIDTYFSQEEYEQIKERMAEVGITNMSGFIRKIVLKWLCF